MRALIQRVSRAAVTVEGTVRGSIGKGYLVFLGVREGDDEGEARYLARRVSTLRLFTDAEGKMNLSLAETGGRVLVISQFTLHADTRKGNRPSYSAAAAPEIAERLYGTFVEALRAELGAGAVETGVFRAMMEVELVNDGPVTVMLHSRSDDAP